MRQIDIKKLTVADFSKYGEFCDLNKEFSEEEINSADSLVMHWEVIT